MGNYVGVARGAGWQQSGAYINLGSFYIVGLPIGCLLAFAAQLGGRVGIGNAAYGILISVSCILLTLLNVQGLLIGMVAGAGVQFVSFAVITHLMDWDTEVNFCSFCKSKALKTCIL